MKKVLGLFILTLVLGGALLMGLGCSSTTSTSKINPPSWIQGTWKDSSNTVNFTTSDIVVNGVSFTTKLNSATGNANYSESSTSTEYTVGSPTVPVEETGKFINISSTSIRLLIISATSNQTVATLNMTKV